MSDEQAIERDELTSILRERCDQDFDGECHLTNAEADRIITFLATPPVTGEVGELVERLKEVTALLMRYRMETPMGHSPHMICHQADAAIERANATLSNTEQPS